jgi:hypothetical protein
MIGRLRFVTSLLFALPVVLFFSPLFQGCTNMEPEACPDSPLVDEVRRQGTLRVIVHLAGEYSPESELGEEEALAQRQRIQETRDQLVGQLAGTTFEVARSFESVPQVVLNVGEEAMCRLLISELVESIEKDTVDRATG